MKNSHRVVWSKGMFLTPQHFQTQDRYFEDLLQFRFATSHFANWGVIDLAADSEALANGLFSLQKCRGVLPDGLIFDLPHAEPLPPSRDLAEHFPPTEEALDVYLAVPERRHRARNVTLLSDSQPETSAMQTNSRYVAETQMVLDENKGVEEKPVQVAKPNFRLLFGDENLDGFSSLRITQVIRNAAGSYVVNPRFVTPCLDIASSEYLMMLLRRQIEILATKSSSLAASQGQRGKSLAEFTTSNVANFWLLHTVNTGLPVLKHIWAVRRGHPEALFVAMLQLAGALSTFSSEAHSKDLPDYDHDNLGHCFQALDDRVRSLLETVIPSKFVPVALRPAEKFIWAGTISEDRYFKESQFFLAVSARMGVDDLIRETSRRIKVASPGEIQRLVRNALPGIILRHTPTPPAAIPLKLDNQYFSLNQSGPLWDGVVASRSISVSVPSEIPDPKMEIIIVLG